MSWKSLQKKKKINVSIPAVSSAGNDSHYFMNCCSINQSHHPTKASNGIPSSSFLCVKFDNRHSVCDENFLFQRFFLFLFFFCVLCFFLFLSFWFPFPRFCPSGAVVLWATAYGASAGSWLLPGTSQAGSCCCVGKLPGDRAACCWNFMVRVQSY